MTITESPEIRPHCPSWESLLASVGLIRDGETLLLRINFEPVLFLRMLSEQGFDSWVETGPAFELGIYLTKHPHRPFMRARKACSRSAEIP